VLSARSSNFRDLIEKIDQPDDHTVVFHLKFATAAFLPALADPFAYIYEKKILDDSARGPHWYEKNVMGSGPFYFDSYDVGQTIKGSRNPNYHVKGLPHVDHIVGVFAPKEATRVAAIRSDQAAAEFRGLPPSARDELKKELGDQIAVQESDWNCGSDLFFNEKKPPFDDARVRRALTLAIDRWGGSQALSKIAIVKTVGGIAFPGSPMAATKDELQQMAGFWPDIEKSRVEAKKLLKEAGQENLSFELLNRDVDQPYKYNGTWLIDQWSKIGVTATQKVAATGPWFAALRSGDFDTGLAGNCQNIVNPLLDVHTYLPRSVNQSNYGYYEDPKELELHEAMLHEGDPQKQRALMYQFVKQVMDTEAHVAFLLWWNRIVPYRSYMHGWKIGPSHYLNQDLSTIWLSPPQCGKCTDEPTTVASQ
jgi:peptide/nickel transport system substrate-binding protein